VQIAHADVVQARELCSGLSRFARCDRGPGEFGHIEVGRKSEQGVGCAELNVGDERGDSANLFNGERHILSVQLPSSDSSSSASVLMAAAISAKRSATAQLTLPWE
jgi:hypothetical protein